MIFWAGKSSDDFRVIVEKYPSVTLAARKLDAQAVPGRNGDIIFPQAAFNNYVQSYEVYVSAEQLRLPAAMRGVAAWLCGPRGYQTLSDSYDIDTYREAYYAGPLDVDSILHRFGRATIEFNCKPQRFLRAGDTEIQMETGQVLNNPTPFAAKPLITVSGTGPGVLTVGSREVEIKSFLEPTVILDCEAQNAYSPDGANRNGAVSAPEFPELEGKMGIKWTGGITAVKIRPRWWTL